MLRESGFEIAKNLNLEVSEEREPKQPAFLARTAWIQDHDNQRALLDAFSERAVEEESLTFFYAKRTPLADDDRRVIIAVGLLKHKGKVEQYKYATDAPKGHLRAMMWERPIQHSIRQDAANPGHFVGGIVMPYHAILERAAEDDTLDPAEFLACAPDELRDQFSYASEHVTHGAAITALLACKTALERASKKLTGPWPQQIAWIDQQINRLWKLSGPCPGLGSALSALEDGFNGSLFALALSATLSDTDDPWVAADKVFRLEAALLDGTLQGYGSLDAGPVQLIERWTWTEFEFLPADSEGRRIEKKVDYIPQFIVCSLKAYRAEALKNLSQRASRLVAGIKENELGFHRVIDQIVFLESDVRRAFPTGAVQAKASPPLDKKYPKFLKEIEGGKYLHSPEPLGFDQVFGLLIDYLKRTRQLNSADSSIRKGLRRHYKEFSRHGQ